MKKKLLKDNIYNIYIYMETNQQPSYDFENDASSESHEKFTTSASKKEAKKVVRQKKKQERLQARMDKMSPTQLSKFLERQEKRKLEFHKMEEMSKEEKKKFREEKKKVKREEQDIRRKNRFQKRLAKLSEDKRVKLQSKRDARDAEKAKLREMSKEERIAYRNEKKEARDKKKKTRTEREVIKLEKMSPQKKEAYLKKKNMSKEEKKLLSQQRKADYQYLKDNLSEEIPEVVTILLDGNNIRGGGPKRLSREEVASLLEPYQTDYQVICYFDGASKKIDTEIETRFSGDDIADNTIILDLETEFTPSKTLLVTCDRGLGVRALKIGTKVMRNGTFKKLKEIISLDE